MSLIVTFCRHKVKRVIYYSDEEESSSDEVQYIQKCKSEKKKTSTREAPPHEKNQACLKLRSLMTTCQRKVRLEIIKKISELIEVNQKESTVD